MFFHYVERKSHILSGGLLFNIMEQKSNIADPPYRQNVDYKLEGAVIVHEKILQMIICSMTPRLRKDLLLQEAGSQLKMSSPFHLLPTDVMSFFAIPSCFAFPSCIMSENNCASLLQI